MNLPASVDTERAILGSVMLDNGAWNQAKELQVSDFHLDSHRKIFASMMELAEDGKPIDSLTMTELMSRQRLLANAGGVAYISSLTDGLPYRANIEHYVKTIRDKSMLRRLISLAQSAVEIGMEGNRSAESIAQSLRDSFTELAMEAPQDAELFIRAQELISATPRAVDWRVSGVIEQGTSGFIVGLPKAAKSFVIAYLAVCLATGHPWFDLQVEPCRVALVSREDRPETTARRMQRILTGMGFPSAPNSLLINTRKQSAHLMLDNAGEMNALIRSLKKHKAEFLILDVLNVLHDKDENDNAEMRSVLKRVDQIRADVGCQVCIVHHARKNWEEGATLSEIARGASAISGFAEFIIGVRLIDEKLQVRQLRFETKAAEPLMPFTWKIQDQANGVQMGRIEWQREEKNGRRKAV